MYGMVNRAIVQYIRKSFGLDTWERTASIAGIQDDLVHTTAYPRTVYDDLLTALCEVTTQTPRQILTPFGEFMAAFLQKEAPQTLSKIAGVSLPEALSNLDVLFSEDDASLNSPSDPSFWISDLTEDSLILHHNTPDEATAPVVVGFVRGLSKMLNTECSIIQIGFTGDTGDHDEFAVAYENKEAFSSTQKAGALKQI